MADKNNTTYKYESSQPPTMSTTGGVAGQGTFAAKRCTTQELEEIPNVLQLQEWVSKHALAPSIRDFVNLGAEDDVSLAANRQGMARFALRPRVLKDVSQPETATTVLQGRVSLSFPLCVAPFAGVRAVHPDGETAIARAALKAGIVYTVPNWASTPAADLVKEAGNNASNTPFFFQIYPHKPTNPNEGIDRKHLAALLQYLRSLGPHIVAVIVTCDTVNNSNREKTYKSKKWLEALNKEVGGFPEPCALPQDGVLPYVAKQGHSSSMTWEDIRWTKEECQKHNLALIVKGIMTSEDTREAVKAGVDAVVVSNHGGRQLDGTLGTVEVVEECVRATKGSSVEVFVDGGIRRGKDIAKCLALGAKCVLVGRPMIWGLAAAGEQGVARALAILQEEFQTTLQLMGCQNPQQLSRSHVEDRQQPAAGCGASRDLEKAHWLLVTTLVAMAAFALGRSSSRSG